PRAGAAVARRRCARRARRARIARGVGRQPARHARRAAAARSAAEPELHVDADRAHRCRRFSASWTFALPDDRLELLMKTTLALCSFTLVAAACGSDKKSQPDAMPTA